MYNRHEPEVEPGSTVVSDPPFPGPGRAATAQDKGGGDLTRRTIRTPGAPGPVGPYSQAAASGGIVFVSGQLGIDPGTGRLEEGVEAQASRALENIKAVLAAGGMSMSDTVKTTVLLADMADFPAVNSVYAGFFEEPYPARAAFAVKALPLGALVEIEAVAVQAGGRGDA